jgi:hypothetical protein
VCCLTTFEDITAENYVAYRTLPSGAWRPCLFERAVVERLQVCCAESTLEGAHAPLERVWSAERLHRSIVTRAHVPTPQAEQFGQYVAKVEGTDCAAELRRLVALGPPRWLADAHGLPLPEGDTHVERLWLGGEQVPMRLRLEPSAPLLERSASFHL